MSFFLNENNNQRCSEPFCVCICVCVCGLEAIEIGSFKFNSNFIV